MRMRRMTGFTLVEMMIVLVIIGILAAIALPTYRNRVVDARRSDCMATMQGFAQAMEKHYALQYSYTGAAADDKDAGVPDPAVFPDQCPIQGEAHYDLSIASASAGAFTLKATPRSGSPQYGDGYIGINHLGEREWDTDNSGAIATGEKNWHR